MDSGILELLEAIPRSTHLGSSLEGKKGALALAETHRCAVSALAAMSSHNAAVCPGLWHSRGFITYVRWVQGGQRRA